MNKFAIFMSGLTLSITLHAGEEAAQRANVHTQSLLVQKQQISDAIAEMESNPDFSVIKDQVNAVEAYHADPKRVGGSLSRHLKAIKDKLKVTLYLNPEYEQSNPAMYSSAKLLNSALNTCDSECKKQPETEECDRALVDVVENTRNFLAAASQLDENTKPKWQEPELIKLEQKFVPPPKRKPKTTTEPVLPTEKN